MRSFLFKIGGGTPKAEGGSKSQAKDLPKLLDKAANLVQQLRSATSEDFPLLNEATRLGTALVVERFSRYPIACHLFHIINMPVTHRHYL
jgi:hypothetical protein